MEKYFSLFLIALLPHFICCSCTGRNSSSSDQNTQDEKNTTLLLGKFSADSAYKYIERQMSFGPRVPGTAQHDACAQYLIDELDRAGADTMYIQKGDVKAFTGEVLPITNIIGSFNPKALRRVLLVAHWDTRPWADNEGSPEKRLLPVPGANDGASGVGVLLEIARNLAMQPAHIGVDIMFVDAEDYGDDEGFADKTDTWCLGTQYWTKHMVPYTDGNLPIYGILLDMVGGNDARFHYETFSHEYASAPTLKIWSEAKRLRYDNVFVNHMGATVTDDHIFLTKAGIPTVDIIENMSQSTGGFPHTWHTLNDDMSGISKATLKAVGETVLNVIYKEKEF